MKNRYSFSEIISTSYALILTKLFYRHARLVRRPVYIRGRKSLDYEKGLTLGHSCRFDLPGDKKTLHIGRDCRIGDNVHIVAYDDVRIGNDVLMASKIFISDTNHGSYKGDKQSSPYEPPNDRALITSSVQIGNNVWIGENAVILAGSSIGDGCIVGANAIVSNVFEDNCIIAGIPAKVLKKWNPASSSWEKPIT